MGRLMAGLFSETTAAQRISWMHIIGSSSPWQRYSSGPSKSNTSCSRGLAASIIANEFGIYDHGLEQDSPAKRAVICQSNVS